MISYLLLSTFVFLKILFFTIMKKLIQLFILLFTMCTLEAAAQNETSKEYVLIYHYVTLSKQMMDSAFREASFKDYIKEDIKNGINAQLADSCYYAINEGLTAKFGYKLAPAEVLSNDIKYNNLGYPALLLGKQAAKLGYDYYYKIAVFGKTKIAREKSGNLSVNDQVSAVEFTVTIFDAKGNTVAKHQGTAEGGNIKKDDFIKVEESTDIDLSRFMQVLRQAIATME
jgi:hypothetical protein